LKKADFCTQDGNVKVRVETGFKANDEISVFYDAMIAKLVVWAGDRPAALAQMARSLHDYQILGLHGHNVPFLIRAVRHPDFIAGQITTDFIARNATDLIPSVFILHFSSISNPFLPVLPAFIDGDRHCLFIRLRAP
jgi:acetyl/propionyl-CoA carboxylase alpha subunit